MAQNALRAEIVVGPRMRVTANFRSYRTDDHIGYRPIDQTTGRGGERGYDDPELPKSTTRESGEPVIST